MERRVNKLNHNPPIALYKKLFCAFIFAIISSFGSTTAQQKELDGGILYTLNSIKVTGNQNFNENTVIAFTGLKKGDQLYVPGDKLSNVTKKLWAQNLFSDITFYATFDENKVDLELYIIELPKLNQVTIEGVRKRKAKDIIKDNGLTKGTKITKNLLTTTKNFIQDKYKEKGYLNTSVIISTIPQRDTTGREISQNMKILVDKRDPVKVKSINFDGNEEISNKKLRRFMKKVKRKNPVRFYKKSKYSEDLFAEDKLNVIKKI